MMKRVLVMKKKGVKSKELRNDKSSIQRNTADIRTLPKVSDGGYLWVG